MGLVVTMTVAVVAYLFFSSLGIQQGVAVLCAGFVGAIIGAQVDYIARVGKRR